MILEEISSLLQRGKAKDVKILVQQALDEKITPTMILNEGLIKGMSIIGGKFKNNEVFVPEVLVAARAMNSGLEILRPALIASGAKSIGKALICTVQGDLHDIGKNLLGMIVEGAGWQVVDLGIDVPAAKFIAAVDEHPGAFVGLSCLLTTTMLNMEKIVNEIKATRPDTKILIGGAPVTDDFRKRIGADWYSPDPQGAVEFLNKIG